jgi:hypothetical protein
LPPSNRFNASVTLPLKPVFWLTKAGELEITEMLPDPEDLCWREADGRRTFELRTLIVPRP